jgi:hypothetical protein
MHFPVDGATPLVTVANLIRLADDRESGDVVARCGTFAD